MKRNPRELTALIPSVLASIRRLLSGVNSRDLNDERRTEGSAGIFFSSLGFFSLDDVKMHFAIPRKRAAHALAKRANYALLRNYDAAIRLSLA